MRCDRFRTGVAASRFPLAVSVLALALILSGSYGNRASRSMAEEPQGNFDMSKLDSAMGARIEKIYARPAVDKAMDAFVDAVFAEPALQKRGEKLMQTLGADPKIGEATQAVFQKIGSSAAMQDLVKEVMKQNPDKTPEEIGKLVAARYEKAFNTPGVHKAFQSSFQSLTGKLDAKWEDSAIVADLKQRVHKYFGDSARADKWAKRVTELNGGQMPTAQQAVDLYIDHAWSEDRTEKFLTTLLANPKARQELAAFLDEAIALDAVTAELRSGAADIMGDAEFQDSLEKFMSLMLASQPDEDAIRTEMSRLLTGPNIVKAMNRVVKLILTNDEVRDIAVKHIDRLAEDPELSKLCEDFFDNW